jgi:hypothetical protein
MPIHGDDWQMAGRRLTLAAVFVLTRFEDTLAR